MPGLGRGVKEDDDDATTDAEARISRLEEEQRRKNSGGPECVRLELESSAKRVIALEHEVLGGKGDMAGLKVIL